MIHMELNNEKLKKNIKKGMEKEKKSFYIK